jgi:hypothetical protein
MGEKKKREASLLLQQFRGRHIKFMVHNSRDNRNRVKMMALPSQIWKKINNQREEKKNLHNNKGTDTLGVCDSNLRLNGISFASFSLSRIRSVVPDYQRRSSDRQ